MEAVYIEAKNDITPLSFASLLSKHWNVHEIENGGICVNTNRASVYIHRNFEECLDGKRDKIYILYSYINLDLVKQVLVVIADNSEFIVDNDFGVILTGNQFVARIKEEPNWDWRNQNGDAAS